MKRELTIAGLMADLARFAPDTPCVDAADEILCRIASVDAQHLYGVSQDTLQAIADMMRDEKEQAREVTLPATAAEATYNRKVII